MISNFLVISAFFATRQAVAYHLKRIGNVFFWLGVKNFTRLYKSNLACLFRIFSAWSLHSFSDSIYWEKNASDQKDILQKLQTITTQTSSSSLKQSSKNIAYYLLEIIIAHSSIEVHNSLHIYSVLLIGISTKIYNNDFNLWLWSMNCNSKILHNIKSPITTLKNLLKEKVPQLSLPKNFCSFLL